MMTFDAKVEQTKRFIDDALKNSDSIRPKWGIILGSGMGEVAKRIEPVVTLGYNDLPNFKNVAVAGHRGELILGRYAGVDVVVMSGRYHYYEGHRIEDMTLPISVMSRLGVERLVVSNAAGGVNPRLKVGDLVAIDDLICTWRGFGLNISDPSSARHHNRRVQPGGANSAGGSSAESAADHPSAIGLDRGYPGTAARGKLLDESMMSMSQKIAIESGFSIQRGCYHATTGPNYETRAEYRMMRQLGIDLVGMSTAAEVVHAATVCNMRVMAISMVSNVANVDRIVQTDHQEVIEAGQMASNAMQTLMESLVVSF